MSASHYFIAVPLKQNIKKKLAGWQHDLRGELPYKQWTHEQDLHITLKFLGPVDSKQLHQLKSELSVVENLDGFQVEVGSIGYFGNPKKPRVLWAGAEKASQLEKLQDTVETCAEKAGFAKENRSYKPHVTLAKKWNGDTGSDKIREIKNAYKKEIQLMGVDEIVIYQIHPGINPKYEAISVYKLR